MHAENPREHPWCYHYLPRVSVMPEPRHHLHTPCRLFQKPRKAIVWQSTRLTLVPKTQRLIISLMTPSWRNCKVRSLKRLCQCLFPSHL